MGAEGTELMTAGEALGGMWTGCQGSTKGQGSAAHLAAPLPPWWGPTGTVLSGTLLPQFLHLSRTLLSFRAQLKSYFQAKFSVDLLTWRSLNLPAIRSYLALSTECWLLPVPCHDSFHF